MINEDMIKKITSEVIARIKKTETENCNKSRRKILVLEKKDKLCPDLLLHLTDKGCIIECIDDFNDIDVYDAIVLQGIDNTEIVNLSLGAGNSLKEKIVIEGLLRGKKVYSIDSGTEYRKYADTANKAFYSLFKSYEEKLKSYGISFIGLKELSERIISSEEKFSNIELKNEVVYGDDAVKGTESKKYYDLSDNKLLTEVKLKDTVKNRNMGIMVSKKTIITPAAMDFLKKNKLYIKTV